MLIFYGVIMGIGLGVGYLTPVKNLMLWFAKGLATGIAVADSVWPRPSREASASS